MNLDKWAFYVIMFLLAVAVCCCICGCGLIPQHDNPIPDNPTDIIYRTVEKTNWLVTLSILGVGAGFFAFLNGGSKGLQIMAACLVVLSLTLGVMRYSIWIAALAVISAVALVIYTIYIKSKALREIVAGGETFKKRAVSDKSDAVFMSIQDLHQSPSTKKIVDVIQNGSKK